MARGRGAPGAARRRRGGRHMAARWIAQVAAFALATAAFAAPGAAQEPIRVGALYNLTGGMASIDGPSLKGAQLAAKEINEAGGLLDGRPIELISIDTKTDPQETAKAAQRLLTEDVVAAIGFPVTPFGLAGAPLSQAAGKPFITSGATHPGLPQWVGEYLFLTPFGHGGQSYAVADYPFAELGARRVALWTDN